jgi:alpha-mannosidase
LRTRSSRRAYLDTEFYNHLPEQPVSAFCVGHTHIDVAWLWTLAQTKEKAQRTFSTVLKLMEKYPISSSSQPAAALSVCQRGSARNLQQHQGNGKSRALGSEGAMWWKRTAILQRREPCPSDSVRKRFFKEEFGVESRILWLPDFSVFAALHNLREKRNRLFRHQQNIMERYHKCVRHLLWKGIDGSRIFTYFLTAQDKEKGRKPSINDLFRPRTRSILPERMNATRKRN